MKKIRNSSFDIKVLQILFDLDTVWKKYLHLYLFGFISKKSASAVLKRLSDRGLIQVQKDRIGKYTVSITTEGKIYLAENLGGYYAKTYRTKPAPVYMRTSNEATYLHGMTLATVKLMFMSCGILTMPFEKPALEDLYKGVVSEDITELEFGQFEDDEEEPEISEEDILDCGSDKLAYGSFSKTQMKEMLRRGIFYSISEFREGINHLRVGDPIALAGSRCYGIYFSADKYFLVYASPYDRAIRLAKAVEVRLSNAALTFAAHLSDYNVMRELSFHYGKEYRPSNCAIVFTVGVAQVKTMATGIYHAKDEYGSANDFLISQGVDVPEAGVLRETLFSSDKTMFAKSLQREQRESRVRMLLIHDCDIFNKIFAMEANNAGADSLSYLLRTSAEAEHNEYLSFGRLRDFTGRVHRLPDDASEHNLGLQLLNRSEDDDEERVVRIVYLPVYEVNEMAALRREYHTNGERFLIFTRKGLAKTISAVVGGYCAFYDSEKKKPMRDVPVFDKRGYTAEQAEKRREAVEKKYGSYVEAVQRNQEIRSLEKQKKNLPKDQREEINRQLRTLKAMQKKEKGEKKYVAIKISVPSEIHAEWVQAAKTENQTLSDYLRQKLMGKS